MPFFASGNVSKTILIADPIASIEMCICQIRAIVIDMCICHIRAIVIKAPNPFGLAKGGEIPIRL